jgi:hypothetical protein
VWKLINGTKNILITHTLFEKINPINHIAIFNSLSSKIINNVAEILFAKVKKAGIYYKIFYFIKYQFDSRANSGTGCFSRNLSFFYKKDMMPRTFSSW